MNEVKAYITAGTLPAKVVAEFERRMTASGFRFPEGYSMQCGRGAAKRDEAVRSLPADVAVLFALIVATLVVSLTSFRIAAIIAAVGGVSIGFGSFGLWSFRYPLGFVAVSLTTMAGFTASAIGGGGFWTPLAIAIAGGIGGATLLALDFVPSIYLLLMCDKR